MPWRRRKAACIAEDGISGRETAVCDPVHMPPADSDPDAVAFEDEDRDAAAGLERQPRSEPAVSPATIRRWQASARRTSGRVTITEAAMIRPQGSSCSLAPEISAIATGTVRAR